MEALKVLLPGQRRAREGKGYGRARAVVPTWEKKQERKKRSWDKGWDEVGLTPKITPAATNDEKVCGAGREGVNGWQ